jgi:DNA-binding CsgD family transcriptional regulator
MMPRSRSVFFLETVERLTAGNPADGENDDFLSLRYIARPQLLTFLGRFNEALEECRAAVACFEALAPGPRRSHLLAVAYNNLGILCALASRDTHDYNFVHWFEEAYRYYLESPEPIRGQMGQTNIGSYMIQTGVPAKPGEIDVFIDALSRLVPYVSVFRAGSFCGTDSLARAELAYYRGDLIKAEQFALQTVYQGREKKQYEVENRGLFYLMRMGVHKGDITGIREIEKQLEAQLEIPEYLNRYIIHDILIGRFYSCLGLLEKIAPWLRNEDEEGESKIRLRGFDSLIKARCLFCEKNFPAALKALEEEKVKTNLRSFLLGFLEMNALEATIRYQLGDRDGAFGVLRQAYNAASPHSLDMPFIELGEYMSVLAGAVLKERENGNRGPEDGEIPREWLQAIRKRASAFAKKRSLTAASYSDQEASPDLSNWELEILSHLSQGYTGGEIAAAMNISVKMVKSAIRSLYVKLGVTNRAGAVRIAAERGLLANED